MYTGLERCGFFAQLFPIPVYLGKATARGSYCFCFSMESTSFIEAENYDSKFGTIQSEICSEGGKNLGSVKTGDYVVYKIRNVATGLYIDGTGFTSNGSNACQSSNNISSNQQWKIIKSGDYIMIQNSATGLYLDGMGRTSNGSNLCQWGNSGRYSEVSFKLS